MYIHIRKLPTIFERQGLKKENYQVSHMDNRGRMTVCHQPKWKAYYYGIPKEQYGSIVCMQYIPKTKQWVEKELDNVEGK